MKKLAVALAIATAVQTASATDQTPETTKQNAPVGSCLIDTQEKVVACKDEFNTWLIQDTAEIFSIGDGADKASASYAHDKKTNTVTSYLQVFGTAMKDTRSCSDISVMNFTASLMPDFVRTQSAASLKKNGATKAQAENGGQAMVMLLDKMSKACPQ